MTSRILLPAAGALAVVLGGSVLAQPASPYGAAPYGAAPDPRAGHMQERRQEMAVRRQQRAQELAVLLNLRPDQQQAFATYEAAVEPHREGGWGRERGEMQNLTTPQLLDRRLQMMDRRMAEFRQRAQATKAFYVTLSPEQQRVFDILQRRDGHRWAGPHGAGPGPEMGPEMGRGPGGWGKGRGASPPGA